jgi:type II secretory pathway pseudopilin PulG
MTTATKDKKGASLVEILVSIFILSAVFLATVNSVMSAINLQSHIGVTSAINNSAITAFERMNSDVRNATRVVQESSTFDTSPGQLTVEIPGADGLPSKTVTFSSVDKVLKVSEDSIDKGPLTTSDTSIDNLIFRLLSTGDTEAVRIEMTLSAGDNNYTLSQNFYSTIVLRGSY